MCVVLVRSDFTKPGTSETHVGDRRGKKFKYYDAIDRGRSGGSSGL